MGHCRPVPFSEETFSEYVGRAATSAEIHPSPLFHVTTLGQLKEILKAERISPVFCELMQRDLVYAFYGRPAYRTRIKIDEAVPLELQPSEDQELANPLLFPVCIALKSSLIQKADAFFPFDTGAFLGKRYSRYIGVPDEFERLGRRCHDFEMRMEHDTPNKFVSCFYGTNSSYFRLYALATLSYDTTSDDVKSYHRLITTDSISAELDDRRGALEVQFNEEITINSDNVDFVVLPSACVSEDKYSQFFMDRGINLIPYFDTKGKVGEHRVAMVGAVFSSLVQRGIIDTPANGIARNHG